MENKIITTHSLFLAKKKHKINEFWSLSAVRVKEPHLEYNEIFNENIVWAMEQFDDHLQQKKMYWI